MSDLDADVLREMILSLRSRYLSLRRSLSALTDVYKGDYERLLPSDEEKAKYRHEPIADNNNPWDELGSLSREQLIMECVKRSWLLDRAQCVLDDIVYATKRRVEPGGSVPPTEWRERISKYALARGRCDLREWGVARSVATKMIEDKFGKDDDLEK